MQQVYSSVFLCVYFYTNQCRWSYLIGCILKGEIVVSKIMYILKLSRHCQIVFPINLLQKKYQQWMRILFCLHSYHQNISLYFLVFASLIGIKQYLTFTSNCISMVTKEIWSLLTWTIQICNFVNYLSCPFLYWAVWLFYEKKKSLWYILD